MNIYQTVYDVFTEFDKVFVVFEAKGVKTLFRIKYLK